MREPHVYLSDGFIIEGTPISQEEFETVTESKAFKKPEQVIYLKDVTILGHHGKVADVAFFVLDRAAAHGVGRSSIKVPVLG